MNEKSIIEKIGCDNAPSLVMWAILDLNKFKPYAEKYNLTHTVEMPGEEIESYIQEFGVVPVED